MTKRCKLLLLLLLSGSTGCGPELVGGSERGEVETVMTDDPASAGPSQQRIASQGPTGADAAVALQGSVTAEAAVAVVTAGGVALPVTGPDATATLALGAGDQVQLGRRTVGAGRYPAVRVTFRRVEVALAVPLPLPSGGEGRLSVMVDLSAGPLVVEVPVAVEVADDESTTVRVDLNSGVWLAGANPLTGIVTRESFAAAVGVEVEGPR